MRSRRSWTRFTQKIWVTAKVFFLTRRSHGVSSKEAAISSKRFGKTEGQYEGQLVLLKKSSCPRKNAFLTCTAEKRSFSNCSCATV